MAFTKKEKAEIEQTYQNWLKESQAVYILSYKGMTMKDVDTLRAKARDTGAHLHVVKNTLFLRSLEALKLPHADIYEGTSLVGFAPNDAPALAKILSDAAKNSEDLRRQRRIPGLRTAGSQTGEIPGGTSSIAGYARQVAGIASNPRDPTRAHAGRTRPPFGVCRQSSFGATCRRIILVAG